MGLFEPIRRYGMSGQGRTLAWRFANVAATAVLLALIVYAQGAGAADFHVRADDPFTGPLEKFIDLITGNVAFAIASAGIVACLIATTFGREMRGSIKKLIKIVMVIFLIMGGFKVIRWAGFF